METAANNATKLGPLIRFGAVVEAGSPRPEIPGKRWLSYAELAERLGVCERTIRREVDEGKLPRPIKIRGCVRFDWQEVAAALTARKQN